MERTVHQRSGSGGLEGNCKIIAHGSLEINIGAALYTLIAGWTVLAYGSLEELILNFNLLSCN